MKKVTISTYRRMTLLLALVLTSFWACQKSDINVVEEVVTFPSLYDSLKAFDRAVIVFTTENGTVLDTIFDGKVTSPALLENLKVENWDGGRVVINVTGYAGDEVVYRVDKKFNGKTDNVEDTFIRVVPGTTLTYAPLDRTMLEGDSIPLPDITIKPANLSDKSLSWHSSDSEVVLVGTNYLKALKRGAANVTASLNSDPTKTLTLKITVEINGKVPESLALSPETLYVASKGAAARFQVSALPLGANTAVSWRSEDSTIAAVSADGWVSGLKKGETKLWATSKEKAAISVSAVVDVSDPLPVSSVSFLKDSTDLYINGAAESLLVEVLPLKANQKVEFSVSDSTKVRINNGRISGLVVGDAFVFVTSIADPAKLDTLRAHVLPSQVVDSVRLSARSLKLYIGGESQVLTAKVMPIVASPKIQWRSSQPGIASVDGFGKVSPVTAGLARIYAISLADGTKQDSADVNVKVDAPQMSVGQDTVIALGQTVPFLPLVAQQEYGLVVQFKWDLDGDLAWDDSSASVKSVSYKFDQEKEYTARFYVRDTEGNQTIVLKKIRAVKGPVVNIVSPANNSYSRTANIAVTWTVNEVEQDSLKTAVLKNGVNTLSRTFRDATGTPFSTAITVTLDSLAPNKPQVRGPGLVANSQPTWTWGTGGAGGNGMFRAVLDVDDFSAAVEVTDTLFTPAAPLSEGPHTLYVQERDAAGNWSASGIWTLRIDITPPLVPDVKVSTPVITNNGKPTWSWTTGGGGNGSFQYKLDNNDFTSGATATTLLSYTPVANLTPGLHTLFVRERDSTGIWSLPGSAPVTLDFDAPLMPKVVGSSPTSLAPKWTWSSGGNAGSGDYRFHLGTEPTSADAETKLLEYIMASPVSGQTYTLYVQERDAAGNWSLSGNLPIKYDLTKPTVAISVPQASGVFITNVDGITAVTVSGIATANAPNTISKVSYSLDDGVPIAATLGVNGAWSFSVALPTEKTYTLKVTATDNLSNDGEATLSILRDRTGPPSPKLETSPTSPTNSTTGTWTWSPVPEGVPGSLVNGNYRYSIDGGTTWKETTLLTVTITTLKEGAQTFLLQQQDNAKNWSASTPPRVVTVDTNPPDAVTFTGTSGSYTNVRLPIWTWSPSTTNPGINSFDLTLEGTAGTRNFEVAVNTWKSDMSLVDGAYKLTVRQEDQVEGVLGVARSFTYNVDATSPNISVTGYPNGSTAPTLTGTNSATITGSIVDPGGSGLASATWELSGGTTKAAVSITNPASFSITTGKMTNHATTTLTIKATDKAGNAQASYILLFKVEVAAPTIEFFNAPADGYVSNKDVVNIRYSINGGPQISDNVAIAAPGGSNQNTYTIKTIIAKNPIDETVTDVRTFYRVHESVRFFSPTGGYSDCSSWEKACKFDNSNMVGKEDLNLWLLAGNYDASGLIIPTGANVYGELHTASKAVSERSGTTTLYVNEDAITVRSSRLYYLRFTGVPRWGIISLELQTDASTAVIIDHCLFENIPPSGTGVGTAINGMLNLGVLNITDTRFNNVESSEAGAAVYVNGFQNQINLTRVTFEGTRSYYDAYCFGGKIKFTECTPTQPISYPSTICSGSICEN